ncbi:MAG: winged helix-turn-helix transcriptional regulator [Methanobacterium sp.]|uniref:ArsR/SmtB family transcription factor n=1 Tax=Methanobacterium sp. TaxID=2164 RepID=UPI003D6594F3|nr:winged helix-turn-helix transcriptional regulator [Methanobacterium sp.]
MKKNRCCPVDPETKMIWKNDLQKDSDSLKNANINDIVSVLKIISNPSRLKMVILLSQRDYCVCEFVILLGEKQNLISYNLGILKKHQMVDSYYSSKDKYYKLNDNAMNIVRCIQQNLIMGH